MNTSVHLPKELSARLNAYLQYRQINKNKAIVEAIQTFLCQEEAKYSWHPDILNWEGIPDDNFEIELDRDLLLLTSEEIFY